MTAGSITRGFRSSGNRYHHGTLNTAEPRKAKRFHDLVKKHGGSSAGDRFSVPRHNLGQFNAEAHAGGFGHGHHETGGHFKWTNTHSKQIDQLPPHSQHSEAPEDNPADDTWDPPRDEPTPELPAAISYTEHLKAGGLPHEHRQVEVTQHENEVEQFAEGGLHKTLEKHGWKPTGKKDGDFETYQHEHYTGANHRIMVHSPTDSWHHMAGKNWNVERMGGLPSGGDQAKHLDAHLKEFHKSKWPKSTKSTQHSEEQPPEPVESATAYPNTTTINCDYPALGPPIVPLAGVATEQFSEDEHDVVDEIHLGFGTRGGAGFEGTITHKDDRNYHIKNKEGKTYKGPKRFATLRNKKKAAS